MTVYSNEAENETYALKAKLIQNVSTKLKIRTNRKKTIPNNSNEARKFLLTQVEIVIFCVDFVLFFNLIVKCSLTFKKKNMSFLTFRLYGFYAQNYSREDTRVFYYKHYVNILVIYNILQLTDQILYYYSLNES